MKNIIPFNYAGNKLFLIEYLSELIKNKSFKNYIECFAGSAACAYNLNFGEKLPRIIINDFDYCIYLMHNSIANSTYNDYKLIVEDIFKKFGDIKQSKDSYYAFRNNWNETYWADVKNKTANNICGLKLIILSNACINSMLRFGPNGMNQSFGHRSKFMTEVEFNFFKNRLNNSIIFNHSYDKILNSTIEYNNTFLFLDPPYESREMTYNHSFKLSEFLNIIKSINGKNLLIAYTDVENEKSDILLQYGFQKDVIREMKNISPNRKQEEIFNEVIYFKYNE
jgi:site-specific DNA-adenine methylase